MRKKWMILAGCFFGGILLCGLGAGIGFAEFSGFSYASDRQLGTIAEDTLTYDEEEDVDTYYIYARYNEGADKIVVSDNSLPIGRIEIDVTYNDDFEHPYLYTETCTVDEATYEEGEEQEYEEMQDGQTECYIYVHYPTDDFKLMMKYKDIVLADIKNGQIGTYGEYGSNYFDITVRCHPSMADKIKFVY